jgi:hypothetical protein
MTHRIALLFECLEEDAEELIGIVDLFSVLSDDPNERCLGFRLVQLFQIGAECRDDAFVTVWIPTEDVLTAQLALGR